MALAAPMPCAIVTPTRLTPLSEGTTMKLPVETQPALWGAAIGAAALAIAGFTWGGWVTGGKSESQALQRADTAVVTALAPMCADKFKHAADFAVNMEALKKVDSWAQDAFVEKGGWAKMPGLAIAPEQVTAVARACAVLLGKA